MTSSDAQGQEQEREAEQEQEAPPPTLSERIAAILDPLGGRSAVAARRFGQPQTSQTPRTTTIPLRERHGKPAAPSHAQDEEDSVTLRADEVFPAASLAKVPIAIELMRRADLGQFSLDERFDTSREPRVGGGGVLDYLDPQTPLTLNDLCFLMIGVSDNTAANFLLDFVGMGEVNETLSRLNLSRTKLARRFMDEAARAAHRDNVTTAADMLALLALIRGRALPGAARLRELLAAQQCAEDLGSWLPEEAQLAHKSGELAGAFSDMGILTGPNGACVFCVLTAEQPHLPAARAAVGQVIRMLWDAWGLS